MSKSAQKTYKDKEPTLHTNGHVTTQAKKLDQLAEDNLHELRDGAQPKVLQHDEGPVPTIPDQWDSQDLVAL